MSKSGDSGANQGNTNPLILVARPPESMQLSGNFQATGSIAQLRSVQLSSPQLSLAYIYSRFSYPSSKLQVPEILGWAFRSTQAFISAGNPVIPAQSSRSLNCVEQVSIQQYRVQAPGSRPQNPAFRPQNAASRHPVFCQDCLRTQISPGDRKLQIHWSLQLKAFCTLESLMRMEHLKPEN